MLNPTEIQPTIQIFQGLVQPPYQLFSQLSVNQAEQKVIDDALKIELLNLNLVVQCSQMLAKNS